MLVLTTREIPSAARSARRAEGRAQPHRRRSGPRGVSSAIRPPRKFAGSRKPSTRLASVTVARVPPLAIAGRPRAARRRSRVRRGESLPGRPSATEPPPAPSVWMSMAGSATFATPIVFSPVSCGSPPWRSAMSVRRAAHVERDQVRLVEKPRAVAPGGDTAGRPRQHGARRQARRFAHRRHAAVRLDDQDVTAIAVAREARREILQIARERRSDVGVHHRGPDALVFLDLRQNLGRERDVRARQAARHRTPGQLLVPIVAV